MPCPLYIGLAPGNPLKICGPRDRLGYVPSSAGTIFLAELSDKTQLATIIMTSKTNLPLSVFTGASLALCLVTLVGVLFGEGLIAVIPQNILKKGAALVFIAIGLWMFLGK